MRVCMYYLTTLQIRPRSSTPLSNQYPFLPLCQRCKNIWRSFCAFLIPGSVYWSLLYWLRLLYGTHMPCQSWAQRSPLEIKFVRFRWLLLFVS
jgi:hypothetical protein